MEHRNLAALRSVAVRAFRCQPHHDPACPPPPGIRRLHQEVQGPQARRGRQWSHDPRRPGSSSRWTTSWPWSAMRASRSKVGEGSARRRMRRSWACARRRPCPACGASSRGDRTRMRARSSISRRRSASRLRRRDFDDVVVFRVLQRELGVRFDDVRHDGLGRTGNAEDAAEPRLRCRQRASRHAAPLSGRRRRAVEVAYSRSLASEVRLSTRLVDAALQAFLTNGRSKVVITSSGHNRQQSRDARGSAMQVDLDGQVALVTGAAQGIGRAIADTLAATARGSSTPISTSAGTARGGRGARRRVASRISPTRSMSPTAP